MNESELNELNELNEWIRIELIEWMEWIEWIEWIEWMNQNWIIEWMNESELNQNWIIEFVDFWSDLTALRAKFEQEAQYRFHNKDVGVVGECHLDDGGHCGSLRLTRAIPAALPALGGTPEFLLEDDARIAVNRPT